MQDQTGRLQELGEDWAAAELGGNTDFLERALADDSVAVEPCDPHQPAHDHRGARRLGDRATRTPTTENGRTNS